MVKVNRVTGESGDGPGVPTTVEEAEQALAAAEAAFNELIEERRANRVSMTRADWRAYNDDTADDQIRLQDAVERARRNLSGLLRRTQRRVPVGAASETNKAGKGGS